MPKRDKEKMNFDPTLPHNKVKKDMQGRVRPDANIVNLGEIIQSQSTFKKMQAKMLAKFFRK